MDFLEMGRRLRREREAKGASIKEVMDATKVSRRVLVAIEEGVSEDLPHPVYIKGFVRSYARFLGLDGDELVDIVNREFSISENGTVEYGVSGAADKAFHAEEMAEEVKKIQWPSILLFLSLIAALVAVIAFFSMDMGGKKAVEDTSKSAATAKAPETKPAPVADDASASVSMAGDNNTAKLTLKPAENATDTLVANATAVSANATDAVAETAKDAAAKVKTVVEDAKPAVAPEVVKPADDAAAVPVPADAPAIEPDGNGDHVLTIFAKDEDGCWVGVWQEEEGGLTGNFIVKPDKPLTLRFKGFRKIRVGNVAGVTAEHNGKPLKLEQTKYNTLTLRFAK